eukprot:1158811-Pelagomonas_calceolata.AAC.7
MHVSLKPFREKFQPQEGKFSASPSPAPVSRANAQPSKPACKDVAPSSTQPSTTLVVDKMELSVEERKRLKREKRALRRGGPCCLCLLGTLTVPGARALAAMNVEDGANNNNAGQSEGAAQGAGAPASPEPGSKASKKEEKKRKRAEQQQQQQGEVEGGGGSMAGAAAAQQQQQQQQQQAEEAPAAVGKKAKGNAEEARRIREALGYVPPANSNAAAAAAAAEKSAAAKAAAPAQAGSRFTFGFNIQQQVRRSSAASVHNVAAGALLPLHSVRQQELCCLCIRCSSKSSAAFAYSVVVRGLHFMRRSSAASA